LQSAAAKEIIQSLNATISGEALRSVILIKNNCIYTKSKAALLIAKELDGLWPVLCIFVIIPPFIRNWVYDFIAANRYKWFGKKDSCLIPSPELKDRFL
jgi:predicted DCC family thiol-disulfide oxidoreductase YuxK